VIDKSVHGSQTAQLTQSATERIPTVSDVREIRYYKKDFWSDENPKFLEPHYRLQKSARLVNRVAGSNGCTLLDVGCGPATLQRLLRQNIHYHGIDIAILDPAPNLLELDILENRIDFFGNRFDIVVAQGLFEYLGDHQSQKFSEIAELLTDNGTFIVSYVNFDHRKPYIYQPYSNIQSPTDFRESLAQFFTIHRCVPTSHNWNHSEPNKSLVRAGNMYLNVNIPFLSPKLAVEYFFVCSPRSTGIRREPRQ
jgi:SAM-dependent methyltransferase